MAKVKNVSPLGDLWVPSLNKDVKAGASIDVSDDIAKDLLMQPDNWVAADKAAASVTTTTTPDTPAEA